MSTLDLTKKKYLSLDKLNIGSIMDFFFKKTQPIFTLYIYKVNKNIYKNTRGKSGKFTFIWKYVPLYKRLFIISF